MKDNIIEIVIVLLICILILKFLGVFGILVAGASFYIGKVYGVHVETFLKNLLLKIKSYL